MSLIEQLGGYQNAKERLKRENVLGDDDFKYGQRELLKHRRQHNIFESGDKVVCLGNDVKSLFMTIDVCGNNVFNLEHSKTKRLYRAVGSKFRHCTDKEIAQGFRDE